MDWAYNSARAPDRTTRKFDLDDACCLKSNLALVGHVYRTHFDIGTHESLADLLLRSYTTVPETDLRQFLDSGTPPRGYVFVGFTEPSQGYALIHEDDLSLVDRPFEIGQNVKRHKEDTISGTVISISSVCSLEPIAWRPIDPTTGDYGPLKFTDRPLPDNGAYPDRMGPPQLHNVPVSELMSYEEFTEGDYIVHRQNLGRISAIDRDAFLLLEDSMRVVSPSDPGALEFPITSDPSNLIAIPGNQETMRSHLLPNGDFVWTTDSDLVDPGQFVFTAESNLSRADRTSTYGSNLSPRGYVLALPPLDIHVDWICQNVYAAGEPEVTAPSKVLRASTLQGHGFKCDFGQMPAEFLGSKPVKADSWLQLGDRVRFRDPKDATAKYPFYQHIPPDQSFGHDLNILRAVYSHSEVTVRWQDGSITTESATAVHAFHGGLEEVWPGDIVTLKDGVETTHIRSPLSHVSNGTYDVLRAKNVGVVQAVGSRERIASVRWYRDPDVQLLHGGNTLIPRSYLGELGDFITEVSLYGLKQYIGLKRELDDVVLIAPKRVHISMLSAVSPNPALLCGPILLSTLSRMSFLELSMYLESMRMALVSTDWFQKSIDIDRTEYPRRYDVHRDASSGDPERGFIGKIVSMDTDGSLTVRVLGKRQCRDFRVPWERILLVLDGDDLASSDIPPPAGGLGDHAENEDWGAEVYDYDEEEYDDGVMGVSQDTNGLRGAPRVSEIVDDDQMDVAMEDGDTGKLVVQQASLMSESESNDSSSLSSHLPSAPPPAFSMLDSPPPSDHHFLSQGSNAASGQRFKRLCKEFVILQSSLPPGIFFRTWESRMDLARVLILGPQGTPYEHAPFVIDLHFTETFPTDPPATFFHSWTNGQGAVNPNLYEDGKICLSILNTWHSRNPEEMWSPDHSTVLQILVSITGLVLVKAPFYNEAGYEILAAEGEHRIDSTLYTERTFLLARRFINHALEHPVGAMKDVLAWYYLPKLSLNEPSRPYLIRRAIEEAMDMIEHHNRTASAQLDEDVASGFVPRLSLGAVVMLRKYITDLERVEADFTRMYERTLDE